MPKRTEKRYVSRTGHNYPHVRTGEDIRVEAGDEILNMAPTGLKNELEAGNIEEMGEEEE